MNLMNTVEALVGQRTHELSFLCEKMKKELDKYEREEEVRENRLKTKIREEFQN